MTKRLMACIREYKKASLLAPLFVTAEVILEVLIPFLMASLIDKGVENGDMGYILKIGAALVFCALLSLFFGVLSGRAAAIAATGFAKNLRHDLFYRVQDFSFRNIDNYSTASLVTRVTTDVSNVQNAYQMVIRVAVRSPMMLLFSMIMVLSINKRIALVFLLIAPVLAIGLFLIIKNAFPIFTRIHKTYDKLNRVVQENLRGIRVVKSFVREDYEEQKFEDISQSIFEDFTRAEKLVTLNMPLMQFSIYSSILLIAWLGARLIVGGDMLTGQLMSIITYAMQILSSLMMFSMVMVMLTISRASIKRITEVLGESSDIQNKESPVTEVKDGSITFENVGFSYSADPNALCLMDVNFSIRSGETIGIIGGTGSAKSTLVQLIPRLYDVTLGSLKVGGVDVRDYDIHALRESVAMVLQKNTLFSGTIRENLRWGDENATDEQIQEACKLAQAHEFIMSFPHGYDTHIEQGGSNVSGGQRQRLCIARALLKKPKILILDDSTSAVDTATDAKIRKAFRTYIPQTTKLIIAQRIASVQDADRILVMDDGKVLDIGTHEELLERSRIYQEVYSSQQKGSGDFDE